MEKNPDVVASVLRASGVSLVISNVVSDVSNVSDVVSKEVVTVLDVVFNEDLSKIVMLVIVDWVVGLAVLPRMKLMSFGYEGALAMHSASIFG